MALGIQATNAVVLRVQGLARLATHAAELETIENMSSSLDSAVVELVQQLLDFLFIYCTDDFDLGCRKKL